MSDSLITLAEFITKLGLEAGKKYLEKRVDEFKLRKKLMTFIEGQRKYNEVCSIGEELDYQGLLDYFQSDLQEDLVNRVFCIKRNDREVARSNLISKGVEYAKANNDEARRRVARIISTSIDIIREFYKTGISKKDYILASEIVDSVNEHTEAAANIVQNNLSQKMEKDKRDICETIHQNSFFSLDRVADEANKGNLGFINGRINDYLTLISAQHPLFPEYGYDYRNNTIISKPLTPEAYTNHPEHYVFTGPVKVGDTYFCDPSANPVEYAYRHQLSLVMEIQEAKKYLGDIEDPAQFEADQLVGKQIRANPREFPPAFPCSIRVNDVVYFDYVLLRVQEILDDGTYVISNKEQTTSHFSIEIRIKILGEIKPGAETIITPNHSDFKIRIHDATNNELLKFSRFMKAVSVEQLFCVHVLNEDQDIIAGPIKNINHRSGFTSLDEEIDFLERVCDIERYFDVSLNVQTAITEAEYNIVCRLSELIRNEEVKSTWECVRFTCTIDDNFRESLNKIGNKPYKFSYIGSIAVNILGAEFEVKLKRTYLSVELQDYERLQQLTSLLKNGETVNIDFKASDENTLIDTLRIPTPINPTE